MHAVISLGMLKDRRNINLLSPEFKLNLQLAILPICNVFFLTHHQTMFLPASSEQLLKAPGRLI